MRGVCNNQYISYFTEFILRWSQLLVTKKSYRIPVSATLNININTTDFDGPHQNGLFYALEHTLAIARIHRTSSKLETINKDKTMVHTTCKAVPLKALSYFFFI
jgi:hypothetical protein